MVSPVHPDDKAVDPEAQPAGDERPVWPDEDRPVHLDDDGYQAAVAQDPENTR